MTTRPRLLATCAALVALVAPGGLLLAPSADAALPVAPGATVPKAVPSIVTLGGLKIENSFVSSVGWVKPGQSYPSRIVVTNATSNAVSNLRVTLPTTRGMRWVGARSSTGTAALSGGVVRWTVPSVPAKASLALVLDSKALTLAEEPTLVWRDISSNASVTLGSATATARAHGPKVIPASGGFETARYGDRPFPVVPVDFADFTHTASAADLDTTLNSATNPSSTFNLFQEMSFGQLYPKGTVPSVKIANADYVGDPALRFSTPNPATTNSCTGTTAVDPTSGNPTPLYSKRITDGWYQLPGMRNYYGADANGSALVGALGGVAALQNIDSGCGPAAKTAYDAAVVADPDIDYNDFDTDKDGVVDFFEVIFQGCGGNGASQLGPAGGCTEAPNDNVWPHSSSLENTYTDPVTGLTGYISKDQLRDLEGNLLWFTDTSYTTKTKVPGPNNLRVLVRVGPYNVNPETSIDKASVISHEYGHSLGLPDYYSTGNRETYGDFNLMATDHSQHMDVIAKKELGWIVPDVLPRGVTKVKGWHDSKRDTGVINWVTPAGKPYTLSTRGGDQGIHNGKAFQVALPGRQLVDPAIIASGASGKRLWYSLQGNDFGCAPTGGHNLDFVIPGLGDLPAGTKISASFKSLWDIEWDYDYGFVLMGTPDEAGNVAFASAASANGYTTTSAQNPNTSSCLSKFSNGLTGTSASYKAGTQAVDRVAGNYGTPEFVADSYDISALAGKKGGLLRLSYATDPGLARLGWLIDDLKVTATVNGTDKVLFSSDFENGKGGPDDAAVYPGGCKEDLSVSGGVCTEGWSYLEAGTPSSQEHAYLLEMRDRSGFDFDGRGEDDRAAIAFQPGVLLTYTDEAHGYGNVGTDNPPAQSVLDRVPTPGSDTPNLNDAAFNAGSSYTDSKAKPHVDNYTEPSRGANKAAGGTQNWTFDKDCLQFSVDSLDGDSGNSTAAFDLVGDVTFTTAGGCAKFNYGFAAESVVAPAIGGPGLPVDRPTAPTKRPTLAATGLVGAPLLALVLIGSAVVLTRRRAARS